MIKELFDKAISGTPLSTEDGFSIASIPNSDVFELFLWANKLRERFRKHYIDLCSIVNAKSGLCPEDCSYCAQSSVSKAEIERYPLAPKSLILKKAEEAKASGAKRFCIVTSGKKPTPKELDKILSMISDIRKIGLLPCATLGILDEDELTALKESGLERYHHNIETSERFFPEICSSHTYKDKIKTIEKVKKVGLSLCSGGIFGLGEEWSDRVEMAITLRGLGADSIPINFLIPVKGTRLEGLDLLEPLEALKIISLFRYMLPEKEIRVCGGRAQTLGELNSFVFFSGADGLLIGNYLTTKGRSPEADLKLIKALGGIISPP